eukprot:1012487-Ditylum_brightwellii.AAC.1
MAWGGAFDCPLWARLEVSGVDYAASVCDAVALEDGVAAFLGIDGSSCVSSVEGGGGVRLGLCRVPFLAGGVEL